MLEIAGGIILAILFIAFLPFIMAFVMLVAPIALGAFALLMVNVAEVQSAPLWNVLIVASVCGVYAYYYHKGAHS